MKMNYCSFFYIFNLHNFSSLTKIIFFSYILYFTAYTKDMLILLLIYNNLYCFNYQIFINFFFHTF